ncbi:S-norcoclaurine synthase-like [Quillaja saponaria]|uniref:S-norcoclaurine synthase-like n=1 Tax=Quillaja saponaria TaxID=32244 RepID=A0AAD7QK00_QUISA|nr:S-norcoclaurine synthase-like [Quillaja saponaria]
MVSGQVSNELELNVAASDAWGLYGTLGLPKLIEEGLSSVIKKIEVEEGDGGLGTVLQVLYHPGAGPTDYKEKFTKIDNENRIKEVETIEGGYLDLGFTLYRIRFEVIEKGSDSSIIKSKIEYELKPEAEANVSLVSIQPYAKIAQLAKKQLDDSKEVSEKHSSLHQELLPTDIVSTKYIPESHT